MSLKRRLLISNVLMVLIPFFVTVIAGTLFVFISSNSVNSKLQYENFEKIAKIEQELLQTGELIWKQNPQNLAKSEFYKFLTTKLSSINAHVTVLKDRKAIYSTINLTDIDILKTLDNNSSNSPLKSIKLGETTYRLSTYKFVFQDGSEGFILIFAPVSVQTVNAGIFIVFILIIFIISFIISNIIFSVKISTSLANPLSKLKLALEQISSGNLDYNIVLEGDEEIKDVSRALDQMRLKLEESISSQIRFDENRKMLLSSISHDLKTPITSIKGYVEGILDKVANSPEKQEKYLRTIQHKAIQVNSMIDDLLLYSKLDLNQIPYNFEKTDITKYMSDCIETQSIDVERADMSVSMDINIPDGTFVIIDRSQMKRVFVNLIENAIKYKSLNKDGIIKITLRFASNNIIIEVKDNGIGIPKENLPLIFDRFYRADSARTKAEGSGLGLAIAKQIVLDHDGKIWVRSRENEGTEFMVSLKVI